MSKSCELTGKSPLKGHTVSPAKNKTKRRFLRNLKKVLLPPIKAGLDYLHSSMRRFWESEFENSEENLAYWTKKISNIPTIGVGSVGLDSDFIDMTAPANPQSIDKVMEDISNGKYDLIAVGRALLSDHEWVIKMKEGRLGDIIPYTKEALMNLY